MAVATAPETREGTAELRRMRRSERRLVRPFPHLGKVFDSTQIQFENEAPTSDDFIDIDTQGIDARSFDLIVPRINRKELDSLNVPLTDLQLVVLAEERTRNRRGLLIAEPAESIEGDEGTLLLPGIALGNFVIAEGTRIAVALVLSTERPINIGTAYRKGSWFARKEFRFGRTRNQALFGIQYLSEDQFASLGLPRDTPYWGRFDIDGLNEPAESAEEHISVCVSQKLAAELKRNPSSRKAQATMITMVTDLVTDILVAASGQQLQPVEGSILASVFDLVSRRTGIAAEHLVRHCQQEPQKIRPWVQSSMGVGQVLIASLRG